MTSKNHTPDFASSGEMRLLEIILADVSVLAAREHSRSCLRFDDDISPTATGHAREKLITKSPSPRTVPPIRHRRKSHV
jgi:hypothetical protein